MRLHPLRFRVPVALAFLLLAVVPQGGLAGEFRSMTEEDALRLEKAQLEVQFLEERVARLKERAVRMLQDLQRREGTEGWNLDLDARRWTKPDPPKEKSDGG